MNNYFTADCHFWHTNIIKYCDRPFKSVEQMNDTIISRWNQRVNPEDTVYHVGDFYFGRSSEAPSSRKLDSILSRLKGNIILIRGNHDRNNIKNRALIRECLINYGGYEIFITHNPANISNLHIFSPKRNLVVSGHVHNLFKFKKEGDIGIVNVGVDVWNFRPVSINEILTVYQRGMRGIE